MFGDVTLGEMGILRMTVCKKLALLLGGDVWCQVLQCVAVFCFSVLQCVAVLRDALQCSSLCAV